MAEVVLIEEQVYIYQNLPTPAAGNGAPTSPLHIPERLQHTVLNHMDIRRPNRIEKRFGMRHADGFGPHVRAEPDVFKGILQLTFGHSHMILLILVGTHCKDDQYFLLEIKHFLFIFAAGSYERTVPRIAEGSQLI